MTSMELKEKEKDKVEQPPSYEESALLNEGVKKVKTEIGFVFEFFFGSIFGSYFRSFFWVFWGPF